MMPMRIVRKKTGEFIAAGTFAPGTLTLNAVSDGFIEADIEELEYAGDLLALIHAKENPTPALAQVRRIREIKKEARKLMAEHTDWYVIRKAETGTAIPAPIQSYRAALRQATNDAEMAINALATIAAVRDYKPIWPDAPGE